MIQGVIFDLGNTLVRFSGDWAAVLPARAAAIARCLRDSGCALDARFEPAYRDNLEGFLERGQQDWVEFTATHVLGATFEQLGLPLPPGEVLTRAVRQSLLPSEAMWAPFDDTHAVLAALRSAGYRLAALSNTTDEEHAQRVIDAAGLRHYFDPIVLSAAAGLRKPNPRLFRTIAEGWGLPPAAIAVVGDMLGADVLGAQLAGMRSVWATMDADRAANAAHEGQIVPDATIASLSELPAVLQAW